MPLDPKTIEGKTYRPVEAASVDRAALRARFGAPPPRKREPVTLDYGDGSAPFTVDVGMLTGAEKLALTDVALDAARADAVKAGKDPSKIKFVRLAVQTPALLAAATFVPGSEERVFDGPTDPMLTTMPPAVMDRLSDVAERLNREKGNSHAELKNASAPDGAETTASSPSN